MEPQQTTPPRKPDETALTGAGFQLNNRDLVLFALYEVGGATGPVHTEDVAAQVFKYPQGRQRYRWERYADYPDKERVARELRRLKELKGQTLVKGHVNIGKNKDRVDGWMLSASGVDHIKSIESQIRKAVGASSGQHSKYEEEALRKRISTSECYRIYLADPTLKSAKDHNFTDLLYCPPDSPLAKIRSAFDQLLAKAKAIGSEDLVAFLNHARTRFGEFFNS
jgi:hypothetical protein